MNQFDRKFSDDPRATEKRKKVEKKLAQITVFQIILVLSLPSYAQIIKTLEPAQIYTWIGFGVIASAIAAAYLYKQQIKKSFVEVESRPQDKDKQSA